MKQGAKFRKFWVKSVNNWLTGADYNGKRLKENNPLPTFRQFYFIRCWEDLKGFTERERHSNRDLVEAWLKESENIDKVPGIITYHKYLNIASMRFNLTLDQCRDKYGLYTERQWLALFNENHEVIG